MASLRKKQLAALAIVLALILMYVPIPLINGRDIAAIVLLITAGYLFFVK